MGFTKKSDWIWSDENLPDVQRSETKPKDTHLSEHHDIESDPEGFVQHALLHPVHRVVLCKPDHRTAGFFRKHFDPHQVRLRLLSSRGFWGLSPRFTVSTLVRTGARTVLTFDPRHLKLRPGYNVLLLSLSSRRLKEYLGRQCCVNRSRLQSHLIWMPMTPPCGQQRKQTLTNRKLNSAASVSVYWFTAMSCFI